MAPPPLASLEIIPARTLVSAFNTSNTATQFRTLRGVVHRKVARIARRSALPTPEPLTGIEVTVCGQPPKPYGSTTFSGWC